MAGMQDAKKAARAWTHAQTRLARRPGLPVMGFGMAAIAAGAGQAACLALFLAPLLRLAPARPIFAIGFALLALARAGFMFLGEQAAFTAGAAGRTRLRADIVSRLLAAGPAILRTRHSAELTSAAVDQIEALDGLFARWVPAAALALLGPAFILLAVLVVDPIAGAMLAGAGLLVPLGQALAGIGAAAASRGQFLALARLQARFVDRIRGIATIVLAGRAEDEARALATAADELRRRTMRVLRVVFLSSAMLDCAMAAALIAIALRDRATLLGGHGSAASALFVLLLVPEFFAPLRAFAAAYQDRLHATGAAEALIGLPTWDVSRGPALDGLSFVLPAGEMLVLSGPSGAGKSTVIELLLGFVRPERGRILLNGNDIADIVPEALARLTAWIGQKPVLFAATIRENIRFARPDASDAEIDDAARQSRVTDFASRLPNGLDTAVGEGGHGISGGQAQRVAIARAFLKQAPLLLLDEPTNHLDPATEAEVLASLRRLAVGKTVVMASHTAAAHAFGGRRLELRDGRAAMARGAA
jgi:ATP-binding cassette subfamily C protein CydD